MNLRKRCTPALSATVLVISAIVATSYSVSALAVSKSDNSFTIAKKDKLDPNGPLSKLEVIMAVKHKYKGDILSVKKQKIAEHKDCHHVRFLSKAGDFMKIKVQCE
ncbi:MAG: hypothetical protein KAH22_11700 [Thiotrichaceae bacterium]|nr:hypothetical protein [Thiotrichaceae bacterium]